jgi:hypothetical protein
LELLTGDYGSGGEVVGADSRQVREEQGSVEGRREKKRCVGGASFVQIEWR